MAKTRAVLYASDQLIAISITRLVERYADRIVREQRQEIVRQVGEAFDRALAKNRS